MIKRMFFLLYACIFLAACAGEPAVISAQEKKTEIQNNKYAIIPEAPRPGDPVTIGANSNEKEVQLIVDGKQVSKAKFFTIPAEGNNPDFRAAIIAVPTVTRAGSAVLRLTSDSNTISEIKITIAPREYESQTLHFSAEVSSLVNDPNPERTKESEILWGIWATTGNQIYHAGPFNLPTTATRRTSPFGYRRTNIYTDGTRTSSIHAGVDFGIPTGTAVYACARGKVVLSRARILSGNSVVIEHAPGVYSMYYHLNEVIAKEDDIVEMGALIGRSGATGMVTGAHLHWELRISTEYADPDVFVERPLIDKKLIISKIFN
jgi:murein DD-endopeptidase MepM/ murein hydrolase activator NlpD